MIKAVLAIDKNGLMGNNLELPWKSRNDTRWDLQNFKNLTMGNIIYMGYNTCKSLPSPLPGRLNVVEITKPLESELSADFVQTSSLENFINSNQKILAEKDLFIIGGKKILEKYSNHIEELYLTEFLFEEKGNIYFSKQILESFTQKENVSIFPNGSITRYFRNN